MLEKLEILGAISLVIFLPTEETMNTIWWLALFGFLSGAVVLWWFWKRGKKDYSK